MKALNNILLIFACVVMMSCSKDDDEFMPINESLAMSTTMEAVDMGLSVDWASCNVGAKTPTQYGGHYCWGDPTGTQVSYIADNIMQNISGSDMDIVAANFGNGWRMPTTQEFEELINKCAHRVVTVNGISCVKFTSKNGNSILLPFGGYTYGANAACFGEGLTGYYWTAIGEPKYTSAQYIYIGRQNKLPAAYNVSYGASVRGVRNHVSDDKKEDSNDKPNEENGGSGGTVPSTSYEKPDIDYYDYTAYPTKMKVVYKIHNRDKAKVTSAKIYYGTSSNPTKYVTATVSGVLITATITGLKKDTKYYVKCSAKGKGGTTTTGTTRLGTIN